MLLVNSSEMAKSIERAPPTFRAFMSIAARDLPRYRVPGRLALFFRLEDASAFLKERTHANTRQLQNLAEIAKEYEGAVHA